MPRTARIDFTTPSWMYPIKGLIYFLTHPYLYPLLRARLLPAFLLSIFVLANLFIWTYIPQVAFLALFHGIAGAWINGTILVLGESAAIVALLFESFFIDETLVDIFDAVLVEKGFVDLVETGRQVDTLSLGLSPVERLGRPSSSAVYAPFSLRQIFEFVVLLPLTLLPIVGVPIFLVLTGYRAGPLQHWRYYKLRGFGRKERQAWIQPRKLKYTCFGTVQLLLQLVPVLSMMFLLTTAVGSSLWAVKMEEERREAEYLSEAPHEEDAPPEYTDDPV